MKVLIVGGSISGLMHGVMLKHHGHDVHILEKSIRDPESQGAGVSTAGEVTEFLTTHDRLQTPLSLPSSGVRAINRDSKITQQIRYPMAMSTWDAMYHRLRANFDGHVSSLCPVPPIDLDSDGVAVFDAGKEVTNIKVDASGETRPVHVEYTDRATGESGKQFHADLVIAADGAASPMKSIIAPHAPLRYYVGYIAWRGIVPESSVSPSCRAALAGWFTFHTAPDEYVVVYPIPGATGSIGPGSQALNFVWYSWQSEAALRDILTDNRGHMHRWSVPAGLLREDVWQKQKAHGLATFSREFGEILSVTEKPFVQVVSDCAAPRGPGPGFEGGRVMFVGDAMTVLRPHTGFALNQTARHCLELERRLGGIEADVMGQRGQKNGKGQGEVTSREGEGAIEGWNTNVLEFSHIAQLRAVTIGMMYLKGKARCLPYLLRWKVAELWLKMKNGWRWLTKTQL